MTRAATLALSLAVAPPLVVFGEAAGGMTGAQEKGAFEYDTPPRPIALTKPKYPRAAFDNRLEGTVVLELVIDSKGRVAKARVKESAPGFDEAALKCVKKWRFQPALKDGKPVATLANAPIAFRIK